MVEEEGQVEEIEVDDGEIEVEGAGGGGGPDLSEAIQTTIRETVGAIQQSQPQPQQMQPAPMTQEEINQRLNVYQPNEQFATQFREALTAEEFNPSGFLGLLNEMLNGLGKQHSTYAELMAQMQVNQAMQQIQPQLTTAQQFVQERREESFLKEYPSLEPFRNVLPQIAAQVRQSGQQFRTVKQANDAVAKAAEKFIQSVQPDFKLNQAQKGGPAKVTFPGAGGHKPATKKTKGTAASIWD